MNVPVYSKEGEQIKELELPGAIFDVTVSPDLLWQTAVYYQNNRRQVSANTKTRGEVSGGGRKPWRQKGTGRARHGSRRSPIWVGGGVTFGPTPERVFTGKLNKNMRRKALFGVLSAKAKNGQLVLIDELSADEGKANALKGILEKLPSAGSRSLIALPELDTALIRAANNMTSAETIQARELNVFDIARFPYLVMPVASVKVIEDTFGTSKKSEVQTSKRTSAKAKAEEKA